MKGSSTGIGGEFSAETSFVDSRAGNLAPGFIAAMPQLPDPNFRKTVVFVLSAGSAGALGLVINRPSPMTVRELCDDQKISYVGDERAKVMIGGPVEVNQHLLVIHGESPQFSPDSPEEIELIPGLSLVTARAGLERLAGVGAPRLRCYAGYAGWGPNQLEAEIAEGAWVPVAVEPSLMFSEHPAEEGLWERALRDSGLDPRTLVPGSDVN